MKETKVILKETIESLGIIGSVVNVAKGYARNYLLPQKKAVLATNANLKLLERERTKVDIQVAKERSIAEDMANRLKGIECKITAKVSDEGRLYGSVSVKEIVDALETMHITVDKKKVLLNEPIKQVGSYTIPIRIYKGVEPTIIVNVESDSQ